MAVLTIRNLDDSTHARLRVRAARNGRSMEAEVRAILDEALPEERPEYGVGTRIHALFADLGGVELDIPARTEPARGVDFDE